MLILLAESKTMSADQKPVDKEYLAAHTPVFEEQADQIMAYFESLSPGEISNNLGISHQLAIKAHDLAYDFPHKLTGYKALFGFTGEAYRGLEAFSLTQDSIERINQQLRIVSSIYGVLKPDDIIKPYRSEFNKPLTRDNKTAIQIFKAKNTVDMVNHIKVEKPQDIIDLLPGDADKCVDWKIIRAFAKVHKVYFQFINNDGKLKTPLARRLKELRGKMARQIVTDNIQSFQALTQIKSDQFIYSPDHSKPGLPVFITDN